MKIYYGKNKKSAVKTSLKDMMLIALRSFLEKEAIISAGRFQDDSSSWIDVQQITKDKKAVISIVLTFDPENDFDVLNLQAWRSEYVLDDENMKNII